MTRHARYDKISIMKSTEARAFTSETVEQHRSSGEQEPASERRRKNESAPMPERMTRMEELEALQKEDEGHIAFLKEVIASPRERVTLAGIERQNVVFFGRKKEEWKQELEELESKAELTPEEGKKKVEIMSRIDKVEAMERQAEAVARRDELEKIAKEKAEEIDVVQADLDQRERQQKETEKEMREKIRDLESQQKRLQELQESFARQPSEDVKTQIDAMPRILKSLKADVERSQGIVEELIAERDTRAADLEKVMEEHSAALEHIKRADQEAAELGAVIAAMSIDLGKGGDTKPKTAAEIAPAAEKLKVVTPRPEPANQEQLKPAFRPSSHRFAAAAMYIGGGAAFVGSVAAHAAYYPARFVSRFFENLYHLTMHPGKFFSEIGSKFSSEMQNPPKGKGKAMGFIEGTRYLLFGKRVEEIEKAKKKAREEAVKKNE